MSTGTDKRDEWDRHNRDEAEARAAQQASAGSTHQPVPAETYATQGAPSSIGDARQSEAALIDEYERATTGERLAWLALRDGLESHRSVHIEWETWRDALELTQRAARGLIDRGAHTGAA